MDDWANQAKNSDVVELLQQLVRMKTVNPPGDELEIARYTAEYLTRAGLQAELVMHGEKRASVLARLKGSGEKPGLLYSAHLDTVPVGSEHWQHDPFGGELVDGQVWGRGSVDMKGGLAAMLVAARLLAEGKAPLRGDLVLALTAGEEVNSLGAIALAQRPDLGPVQAVVVGEPSKNRVQIAEKGALWLEIVTRGRTAHGSVPHLGRNAVLMMLAVLHELERLEVPFSPHPMLGGYTRSINTIQGGVKTNVVPDYCVATIDQRTVPGQDHAVILAQVRELVARVGQSIPDFEAEVNVVNDRQPVVTELDDPVVIRFLDLATRVTGVAHKPGILPGYTDGAAFVPVLKAPMIIIGPGEPTLSHQTNEYNEVSQLCEAAQIFTLAALEFLG